MTPPPQKPSSGDTPGKKGDKLAVRPAGWIDKRRDKDQLRNDDVTLLAIGPIPEAAIAQEDEAP